MRFVETPIFTREMNRFLPDDEYRSLQLALLFRPEQGTLIPGTGGLRKLRWRLGGKGKRSGIRIIYYWDKKQETIYMLLAYSKSKQEDLTPEQVKAIIRLVREEFR
jgi:mRNA-degrading endonuclease RelE of RelBE toxin-antitoxin system